MYGQFIELIIFAGIALLVINKLIATLGITSKDDKNKTSFIGKKMTIKDVTPKGISSSREKTNTTTYNFSSKNDSQLAELIADDLIVKKNELDIRSGLTNIINKVPSFNIYNFLKGAKLAFSMIIDAGSKEGSGELEALIDKRYIEQFSSIASSYGQYSTDAEVKLQIAEIYMFGNNIFIKILFTGKDITTKIKNLSEEWTFTKSTINASPEWRLTNIDRT